MNPRIQSRDQPRSLPPPISFPPPQSFPTPNAHKAINNQEATKNKDETWRGQAVSAIVKNLLTENGMLPFVKRQRFLNYIKPAVRYQINNMLGKRVAVPPPRILEEYKSRYPLAARTRFIYNERKKYELLKYEARDIPKDIYDATVSDLNNQIAIKRRALKPSNLSKKLKKPLMPKKVVKTPTPVNILPKYPNNDKKGLNKLKRLEKIEPGVYDHKLDPKLRSALDTELGILCDLATEVCLKANDVDEKNIANRIMDTIKFFREQVNLNVCKRLLNITKNLPIRVFTQEKVNSKEVKEQLKALDGQKLTFRPMYTGRPGKKKSVDVKKADADIESNIDDYDDSEDDVKESDDDGADELDSYEDDDEKGEEIKVLDSVAEINALDSVAEIKSDIDVKAEEVTLKLKKEENEPDETKEVEEKIDQVVNEMDNVETAELYRDIIELSNIIYGSIDNMENIDSVKTVDNEESVENEKGVDNEESVKNEIGVVNEESVDNDNIGDVKVDNIPNIDQDDLEDF